VTGPKYVVEGPEGLAQALGQPIRIDWAHEKLDVFDRLVLKSYNSAVPGQSSIHCMLELRKAEAFDPAHVERIENDVFEAVHLGGRRREVRQACVRPRRRRSAQGHQGRRARAGEHPGEGPDEAARPREGGLALDQARKIPTKVGISRNPGG
jgi:hypothetical protein